METLREEFSTAPEVIILSNNPHTLHQPSSSMPCCLMILLHWSCRACGMYGVLLGNSGGTLLVPLHPFVELNGIQHHTTFFVYYLLPSLIRYSAGHSTTLQWLTMTFETVDPPTKHWWVTRVEPSSLTCYKSSAHVPDFNEWVSGNLGLRAIFSNALFYGPLHMHYLPRVVYILSSPSKPCMTETKEHISFSLSYLLVLITLTVQSIVATFPNYLK